MVLLLSMTFWLVLSVLVALVAGAVCGAAQQGQPRAGGVDEQGCPLERGEAGGRASEVSA